MIRRHPVLAFFLLALAISWAAWIPYAASRVGKVPFAVPAELVWLAEYGPSLAAVILTAALGGRTGVSKLLGRLLRWRVGTRWYAFVLLVTPILAVLVVVLQPVFGQPLPDLSRLAGWAERFRERTEAFSPSLGLISGLVGFMQHGWVATAVVFVGLAVSNGGLSEEVGWRGYALPQLMTQWSPLASSFVVALLWALWHTGTGFWEVVLGPGGGGAAARFVPTYLAQYLVLLIPLSVVYTWVFINTGGSLLLAVLLHASYNITVAVVGSAWPTFSLLRLVVLLWILAAVVALLSRPMRAAAPQADLRLRVDTE